VELVLGAAALTYVAGMLTSVLELMRLVLMLRGGSRDDDR
jgi:Zn-dependent membrane protease YugP